MKKIGIIDSGIGGLTLLKELQNSCFEAEFFYISDEANVPYGGKSQGFMLERTMLMVDELVKKRIDSIILACNTLTAETIDTLRSRYEISFLGIEPFLNYPNKNYLDDSNTLGLILTPATFSSKRFNDLKDSLDPESKIKIIPLDKLALLIEQLKYVDPVTLREKLIEEISFIKKLKLTHLILGCTHYPIIRNLIEKELGVKTIDPNKNVVNHIESTLSLPRRAKVDLNFFYNPNLSDSWQLVSMEDFKFFDLFNT